MQDVVVHAGEVTSYDTYNNRCVDNNLTRLSSPRVSTPLSVLARLNAATPMTGYMVPMVD
jgi:hypothetical protein